MIAAKAITALLMTGLGSMAAGTAAYLEANPNALTLESRPQMVVPEPVRPEPAPPPVIERPPQSDMVFVDPVVITGREHRAPKALARPPKPVEGPCSDWQGLVTGPAGRKVRLLCPR
jgi:hypothetical protein